MSPIYYWHCLILVQTFINAIYRGEGEPVAYMHSLEYILH